MKISEIARRVFVRVGPEDTILKIIPLIQQHGFGKALVFDSEGFRGVFSKECFVEHRGLSSDRPLDELTVGEYMDEKISVVDADNEVYEGIDRLLTASSKADTVPMREVEGITGYVTSKEYTRLFSDALSGKFRVSDLMHYSPPTVYDYTAFEDVINEMTDIGLKHVLVMEASRVIGVITVRDVMDHLYRNLLVDKSPAEITAEEIMSKPVISCKPGDDAAEVAKTMVEKHVGGIPVIEKDRLKGMINRRDLLKGFEIQKQDGDWNI